MNGILNDDLYHGKSIIQWINNAPTFRMSPWKSQHLTWTGPRACGQDKPKWKQTREKLNRSLSSNIAVVLWMVFFGGLSLGESTSIGNKWGLPKMGVPPSSSISMGFSLNHPAIKGYPHGHGNSQMIGVPISMGFLDHPFGAGYWVKNRRLFHDTKRRRNWKISRPNKKWISECWMLGFWWIGFADKKLTRCDKRRGCLSFARSWRMIRLVHRGPQGLLLDPPLHTMRMIFWNEIICPFLVINVPNFGMLDITFPLSWMMILPMVWRLTGAIRLAQSLGKSLARWSWVVQSKG